MPVMEMPIEKVGGSMPKKAKSLYELVQESKYEEKFVAFINNENPEIIAFDSNLTRLLDTVHNAGIAVASTFFVPKGNVAYL